MQTAATSTNCIFVFASGARQIPACHSLPAQLRLVFRHHLCTDQMQFAGAPAQQGRQAQGATISETEAAESGYWDLVYLLYPELAEAAGLGLIRQLVQTWPALERALTVRAPSSPCACLHCLCEKLWQCRAALVAAHQVLYSMQNEAPSTHRAVPCQRTQKQSLSMAVLPDAPVLLQLCSNPSTMRTILRH